MKICDAVNSAHLRGMIHRDLKPGNIRIDPSGEPHVLDFGLARVSEFDVLADSSGQAMTQTGQFVGSLHWAAPEQLEGRPERIDTRTDVYALGVVLYQSLTGRFPYDVSGPLRGVIDNIARRPPLAPRTLLREIHHELETLVKPARAKP